MMKKQLLRLILLCILFSIGKLASAQVVNFYYELKPGGNDRDSVLVFAMSNSLNTVSVSAVNFSFAFQSSCSAAYSSGSCSALDTLVEVDYSWFSNNWGSFLERCEIKNTVSPSYNNLTYNHRFSYGNTSLQTPLILPASSSPTRMLIMKLILDKNCLGDLYMENQIENPINQVSDATFSPMTYQVFRFGSAFPVDFASFEAEKTDLGNVKLQWVTEQELNSDYFQIQKSFTGRFDAPIKVGNVTAAGSSEEMQFYEFWDNSPTAAHVFYRLKHVDTDGLIQYSPIIKLTFSDAAYTMYTTTDPFDKNLTLRLFSSEDHLYHLSLVDLQGRIIKKDQYRFGPTEGDQLVWETNDLPAGMYLLQVIDHTFNQQSLKVYLR